MENDVSDDHENDIRPKVVLVKVIATQYLGAFGETGQLRSGDFAGYAKQIPYVFRRKACAYGLIQLTYIVYAPPLDNSESLRRV